MISGMFLLIVLSQMRVYVCLLHAHNNTKYYIIILMSFWTGSP